MCAFVPGVCVFSDLLSVDRQASSRVAVFSLLCLKASVIKMPSERWYGSRGKSNKFHLLSRKRNCRSYGLKWGVYVHIIFHYTQWNCELITHCHISRINTDSSACWPIKRTIRPHFESFHYTVIHLQGNVFKSHQQPSLMCLWAAWNNQNKRLFHTKSGSDVWSAKNKHMEGFFHMQLRCKDFVAYQ